MSGHNNGGSVQGSVKFAGDEAKDKMYEPKDKKKAMRVLTVIAYVFSVSLAAIMLSMYYLFYGNLKSQQLLMCQIHHQNADQVCVSLHEIL